MGITSTSALTACLAATWYMTGLIWFVQVVHYPLFSRVDPANFVTYHEAHVRLVTRVVVLPMIVELVGSAWLAWDPPPEIGPKLAWSGLAAAAAVWLMTALVQVPLHERLGSGFHMSSHRWLVWSNGVRSLTWTAHAVIMSWMLVRILKAR